MAGHADERQPPSAMRIGHNGLATPDMHPCDAVTVTLYQSAGTIVAADWRWSSPWHRQNPGEELGQRLCDSWPVRRSEDWRTWVNQAQTAAELNALRTSVNRSRPFGRDVWQKRAAVRLDLLSSLRPPGRPKKEA